MTSSEWSTLMHIVHGNTTTTTTAKAKATAKATTKSGKAGPGRPKSTLTTDGDGSTPSGKAPPKQPPKAPPAPQLANQKASATGKTPAADKPKGKPKAPPPVLPQATFELSNYFGMAAWALHDDAEAAAGQLIGKWALLDPNIVLTVEHFETLVSSVIAKLGVEYLDDVDADRKKWVQDVLGHLMTYVSREKAKQTSVEETPALQKLFPMQKSLFGAENTDFAKDSGGSLPKKGEEHLRKKTSWILNISSSGLEAPTSQHWMW